MRTRTTVEIDPVEPLSPELALVDPELAERARARLPDPGSPPRPGAVAPQPDPLTHRASMSARDDRVEPVESTWRLRGRRLAIAAAIAVAVVFAGAGAIWNRYENGGHGDATTATSPNQRPVSPRALEPATRSRPKAIGGSAPRRPLRPPRRPPAFHVPRAPKEPLDEITLPARARRLEAWLAPSRSPNAVNLHHWLYQHAWIVTGARFGWWHGAEALRVLIRVDRRVEAQWRIGYRSEAAARRALAEVEARAN
jgi:hypothetical protein